MFVFVELIIVGLASNVKVTNIKGAADKVTSVKGTMFKVRFKLSIGRV